ncbi:hypothetical protein ACC691_36670, partial [Rhizobium johnstonii]|uniref:hypothetical protein n=1 Tax=Rhizobium johnstonii TaxID=3019933 RepID=UPI003F9BC53C
MLRFSTGEVATVRGSGLVGRRPMPQPAESFEQLVYIDDRGLSVSKTHLEFGQHEGSLWIADRFSGARLHRRGRRGTALAAEHGALRQGCPADPAVHERSFLGSLYRRNERSER